MVICQCYSEVFLLHCHINTALLSHPRCAMNLSKCTSHKCSASFKKHLFYCSSNTKQNQQGSAFTLCYVTLNFFAGLP